MAQHDSAPGLDVMSDADGAVWFKVGTDGRLGALGTLLLRVGGIMGLGLSY